MTESEIILGRLNYVRAWLNSALPHISDDILPWAPAEGMRTVAGQLVEIIEVEAQLVPVLLHGKELSEQEMSAVVGDQRSLDHLKSVLNEVRGRTLAHLATLTDADLKADVSLPQWYGGYWPKACPLGEHFRNIAEHEFYHVGQLITYLWARGDDPYAW